VDFRDDLQRWSFGHSHLTSDEARRIAKPIARLPEFLMQRRGFYQRGGGPRWKPDCDSARYLTPDRRRRVTPPCGDEAIGPALKKSSWVGSMLEAGGGQSSRLNHTSRAYSWMSRGILRDGFFGQHCGLSGHISQSSLLARYKSVLPLCTVPLVPSRFLPGQWKTSSVESYRKSPREKVPSSRFDLSNTGTCGAIPFSSTSQIQH
jgi:hypothetical protein